MYCLIVSDIGPKLQYYLLCDGLPEDKHLREQLQIKKLVFVISLFPIPY